MLRGSHDSLLRQNEEIDRLKLVRIADDQQLEDLEMRGELVSLHESRALQIAANLELNRRFCRPWTRDFLEDLSQAFYAQFHQPIEVTSLVRTVDQQARLQRSNHNAAPIDGDTASSHLAGLTVDIGKSPMSGKERAWISQYVFQSAAAWIGRSRRGAPPGLLPHHGQQSLRRLPPIRRNSAPIASRGAHPTRYPVRLFSFVHP